MNPIILETLKNFDLDLYRPIKPRTLDLGKPLVPKAGNLVKVVTGMRRSGKSYRLFQEMDALIASGISPDHICYFNFEDDRLAPVTSSVGDEVLEIFQTLHPDAFTEGAYLFFDELQEMEGWGPWLRRVVDTRKVTIYATGSSSKMLSSEIATEFRGRAIDYELLPLSFGEYLVFNDDGDFAGRPAFSLLPSACFFKNGLRVYLKKEGSQRFRAALPGGRAYSAVLCSACGCSRCYRAAQSGQTSCGDRLRSTGSGAQRSTNFHPKGSE